MLKIAQKVQNCPKSSKLPKKFKITKKFQNYTKSSKIHKTSKITLKDKKNYLKQSLKYTKKKVKN